MSIATGFNTFGLQLYHRLPQESDNCFYSPLSIAIALSMLVPGARGKTLDELAAVLHLDGSAPDLSRQISELIASLSHRRVTEYTYDLEANEAKDVEKDIFRLHLANALYAQAGYALKPEYLDVLRDDFLAEFEALDFRDPEAAARTINEWVAARTEGMISHLIDPIVIEPLTRLILVNAVYFFAEWEDHFSEHATHPEPFYLSPENSAETVEVPMMRAEQTLSYADDVEYGVRAVEIPYKAMSMLVLLPAEGSFQAVEQRLSAEFLQRIDRQMVRTIIDLQLPKFEMESGLCLKDALQSLGVHAAFQVDGADFGEITDDPLGLVVSEVIHRARVRVDEHGTEAAAATVVVAMAGCASPEETPPPIPFVVNRPFFFLIRDDQTGAVLFVGRVRNPGE
ncbi:MAG: serpin family protein [Gemmatimonadetes bacterium]|nr:serpin family protein [Gemmatimonadota bacterium]